MSLQKYVSEIKFIDQNQDVIYNYLSDFKNFASFFNETALAKISEKIPQIKISNFEFDSDSCRFNILKMGHTEIRIINRAPSKNIKMSNLNGAPFGFTFWIQLLPVSPYRTKIKLTMHAELTEMIKMLVHKKLTKGINQLADTLTKIPYR
ncbi:MAG: hypothetical protein JJE45_01795 [Prolixibacteraceae bacterium]|nr:hypothetical protein [Prolixibacteraceae bacterium]